MSPWKVILATMVIFVCGVVTGALVVKTQVRRGPPFGIGPPGPAPVHDIVSLLQVRLNLTPDQHGKIKKIMEDSQATNALCRAEIAPRLHAEMQRAHDAINQLLTPEQQKKYAELNKERGPRGEGWGGRGGEGRGPWMRDTNRLSTNQSVH